MTTKQYMNIKTDLDYFKEVLEYLRELDDGDPESKEWQEAAWEQGCNLMKHLRHIIHDVHDILDIYKDTGWDYLIHGTAPSFDYKIEN